MGIKKLFIVGVGRSGTTLLQSMLNAHPEICFTPETHFIKRFLVPQFSGIKNFSKSSLLESLEEDKYLKRLNISYNPILDKFNEKLSDKDLVSIFDIILENYARDQNKIIVGDKDPMNASYINQIKYAFPDSYLIHIIRDPRDVVLSRLESDWGKNTSFSVHLAEYKVHLNSVLSDANALFDKKYIEIYYEKLLENPEKELERVCNEIGLDYSNEMLDFQKKANTIVFSDERAWKDNVFKPLIRNNKSKWVKGLTNYQAGIVELVLKKQFLKLGYPLLTKKKMYSFLSQFYVECVAQVFKIKRRKEAIK